MRDIAGSRAKLAFVWLLLAAALLVRAAVPQGYMTERADDGAVQVLICHSDTVWQIPVPEKKAPVQGEQDGTQEVCAFAGLGTGAVPASPSFDLPLPQQVAYSLAIDHGPFVLAAEARQRPPARGPPVRA